MRQLLQEIRDCTHCSADLPLGPAPLLQASSQSRILIAGQAPGRKAHLSGIPWNDLSGVRLRQWLDITDDTFYDPQKVALIPMGFCYPGKGKSGDLPPRKECRELYFERLFKALKNIRFTVLCGQYAHAYYLGERHHGSLTQNVIHWRDFAPRLWPMPHPSPRNIAWFKKNPWFESDMLPQLRRAVKKALA